MVEKDKVPSPAVQRAVQILEYLAHDKPEAGLSDIATTLSINKSTCFNILKTLTQNGMVVRDSRFPVYRLGPKLVELGTASRRNYSYRAHVKQELGILAARLGYVCLIAQLLPDDAGFVVVDRVVPPGEPSVSAPIGHVYPLSAPAIGRVILANKPFDEVVQMPAALELARGDLATLSQELLEVKERGFGISNEEYTKGVNAVAATVSEENGDVALILCVLGPADEFRDERLESTGYELVEIAKRLEGLLRRTALTYEGV